MNFLKGLIKDMKTFLEGKNPKELRVYKFNKEGKQIEVINQLEVNHD